MVLTKLNYAQILITKYISDHMGISDCEKKETNDFSMPITIQKGVLHKCFLEIVQKLRSHWYF